MTGVDLLVAASRPRGIADALADHLAVQLARNDRLASENVSLRAHVKRLTAEVEGCHEANRELFEGRAYALREVEYLRRDLAQAQRDGAA